MLPGGARARAAGERNFLDGGGNMGAMMRAYDWSSTPVGAPEQWPQSLRTAISILLGSGYPMYIAWGSEFVQFYNDAYRPILGATKHPAALGQGTHECFGEIWDFIGPMFRRVLHYGEATTLIDQLLLLDRNGYVEEAYFTFSYSPIREEPGRTGGVFVTVLETTERVLSERRMKTLRDLAARSAEARQPEDACRIAVQSLAANTHDVPFSMLYLIDPDGKHGRLCGSTGLEENSAGAPAVLRLNDGSVWPLARVMETGLPEIVTNVNERCGAMAEGPWPDPPDTACVLPVSKPGQENPAAFLIAGINVRRALDDHYRTFLEMVAAHIATAIANATTYQEERKRAEQLAEFDRAKTAFFSNVSHEFRTPLTLMLGPVQGILERSGADATISRTELELVHRNGLRLLKLVNTLLDFARIEAGRVRACYTPVDLSALTADLASVFRSAIERAGLALVVNCRPGVEPVYVDREMWEKIVLNLLSNALKFTFHGEIAVSLEHVGGYAELSIRDTGIGIPEGELPRVFDRFHRVEGARGRTHEGSGIGLALVHELVKLHGGAVRVESEVGRGSTFFVSIPLGSDHLPADRLGAQPAQVSTATGARPYVEEALRWMPGATDTLEDVFESSWKRSSAAPAMSGPTPRTRLLIADDNADMRDYLRRLLGERYAVECVADGRAALTAATRDLPGLIVADVMMPRLDGFGLLQELRRDPLTATTPVILVSARAGEEARIEGLKAGADDYLVKPFGARELLARISSCLEIARLRQEAAARERESRIVAETERERWYDLLRQAPALVAVLRGPEHVFELANEGYVRSVRTMGGETLLGKPIREALPEIAGQGFIDILDQVYRCGQPYVGNERLIRLDRAGGGALEDRYYNFVYQPSRDAHGRVEGILVHALDVTEQVTARRRIEESESQLRTLTDSIPQLAWMAEPDGRVFWYNRRWYEYTGAADGEMKGWGWQEVHHPDHVDRVVEHFRRCFQEGKIWEDTFPLRGADGNYRWFLSRAIPIRNSEGVPVRWFGTNTDVTVQRETEDRLRESEERANSRASELQAIMDAVPAAILIARDSECRELVGNRTAYEIMPWRFTDTSFLSREKSPDSVKLHKDGAEIGTDQLPVRIAARTLRPVIHYEFEVEHDKTQQCLLGNAVPLLDESGRGRGAVGAFIDITESRRMQERLREAQKLESIGLLAGGIAHDFNNLLVPILGSASLARERVAKNHPVVPLLEDIEGAAERAAHLTRQMLAYAGKAQFMLERVDVSAAIREAISLVRVSIPHGIAVALDLAAGLPAVEADAREIQQILMNVLMNAVEAIETQSGSISIRTELVSIDDAHPFDFIGTGEMSPGRYVAIRISDTGCGMDEATRTRIFDPFFSTKFAGRGLGLAAVAGIIRAHRGGLRVTSAPGKGATFEILLRAASGPEPRCEVSPPEEHVAVNASASVLVVDDEQVVLRMAKLSLEREGYRVYVAESGPAAIHLFKSEARDIDLVVLDLSMPGMNGEETLAALQGIDPNVKAVISSGYSKVEALRTFGSRRTFGFVQKPYRPSQLVAAVKTALAEVQQRQAT